MSDRIKLDILENAFDSLEKTIQQLSNQEWFNQQLPIVQDTLIAGAIQKFEFVYELSLKMLHRQLQTLAIDNQMINERREYSFKDLLRDGLKFELIKDIQKWITYREMRNITSHTYDEEKAMAVYTKISDFLEQCRYLISQLQKRNNE